MSENPPDPEQFVGEPPAGDASPGDFTSNDQSAPSANRESNPSAGGPQGLSGDLGLSSERDGDFRGVDGTGSSASTQGRTDGETPPTPPTPDAEDGDEAPDKPDETSPATHVDRTVGEVQPDEVADKHSFDPDRNPGH